MNDLTFNSTTQRSLDSILSSMNELCKKYNFSVLNTYKFQDILESKGFPITRKAFVFEICNAPLASEMLTKYPEVSVFMPCRISVYENDGKRIVSTMNMEHMIMNLEDDAELHNKATKLFNSLKELVEEI